MADRAPPAVRAVTATYDYDVFGALRSSTGASEQAFRFTGEQQDPDVSGGLYYLRARYYDPSKEPAQSS